MCPTDRQTRVSRMQSLCICKSLSDYTAIYSRGNSIQPSVACVSEVLEVGVGGVEALGGARGVHWGAASSDVARLSARRLLAGQSWPLIVNPFG